MILGPVKRLLLGAVRNYHSYKDAVLNGGIALESVSLFSQPLLEALGTELFVCFFVFFLFFLQTQI